MNCAGLEGYMNKEVVDSTVISSQTSTQATDLRETWVYLSVMWKVVLWMSSARGTQFLHRIWYRYAHVETSFMNEKKKRRINKRNL